MEKKEFVLTQGEFDLGIGMACKRERIRILRLVERDIEIQKGFLEKQPENRKSIEWRITGMEFLRKEIVKSK